MPFYAVIKGFQTGIFDNWAQCEVSVKGFGGAQFKKFKTRPEADSFLTAGVRNFARNSSKESDSVTALSIIEKTVVSESEKALADKYGVVIDTNPIIDESLKRKTIQIRTNGKKISSKKNLCKTNVAVSDEQPLVERNELSVWIDDKEGDQDLMLALSALEEYPDNKDISQSIHNNNTRKRKIHERFHSPNIEPKRIKVGLYNFLIDDAGYINVYISGYCKNIGSWNGIAGFGVYFDKKHPLNTFEGASGRMTHNVGDIEAAIYALKEAKKIGIQKICINTSSEFLLKAVTCWIPYWKNNGWRNKSGKVVQNRKEIEQLDALLREENIEAKWNCVSGDHMEMHEVLKMAKLGAEEYLELHPNKNLDESFDYDFDYF